MMTMADILSELAKALGYGAIGLIVGMGLTWRRAKIGGREVTVPTPHPDPGVWRKGLGLLLVAVAVASMLQVAVLTVRQGKCNEEFRRVIKERADQSVSQAELWSNLERRLAAIGPAVTLEKQNQLVQARKEYVRAFEEYTQARRQNPYPDPRCA